LSPPQKANITFNDFLWKITSILNKNLAICELTILGRGEYHHCTLYLSQLLDTMRTFIDEVLGMTVKEAYINPKDIAKYLGWQLNSVSF
jgi:phosphatidylglycerophosphatase A